mgnify:CR=1 FL=1
MKLIVEIGISVAKGESRFGIRSLLATDDREGEEVYDKAKQSAEIANLIELSNKIRAVVESYNTTPVQPIADKKSSTDVLTV